MKRKPLALLLICALLVTFALAGCGGSGNGNNGGDNSTAADLTADKTAEQIVAESFKLLDEATSYDMEMTIDMSMPIEDEIISMNMHGTANYFVDPLKMKMVMETTPTSAVTAPPEELMMTIEYYIIAEGDSYTMYQHVNGQWIKMSFAEAGLADMMQMDASKYTNMFIDNLKAASIDGEEKIGDLDTVKITLTASGEIFNDMMGELDSLGMGESMDGLLPQDILSQLGDMTFTVWVDKATLNTVKYYMDMTSMMKNMGDAMIASMGEDESLSAEELAEVTNMFDNMEMTMEYTIMNLNQAQDFTLPEEAANAMDLGDLSSMTTP